MEKDNICIICEESTNYTSLSICDNCYRENDKDEIELALQVKRSIRESLNINRQEG